MAREKPTRIQVSQDGDVTVVQLNDRRILDETSIAEIGEMIYALVPKAQPPKFVVDFANVAHMSSSALGMLITLHKRIRERGGELRLCGIQPAILEVFVITRLNEIFQIAPTREQAIQSLKS